MTYVLVNEAGEVAAGNRPQKMLPDEVGQENRDLWTKGIKLAWVEAWRTKNGKVVKSAAARRSAAEASRA